MTCKKVKKRTKKEENEQKEKALSWIRTRDNITTLPGRRECPDMGRPDKGSLSVPHFQSLWHISFSITFLRQYPCAHIYTLLSV